MTDVKPFAGIKFPDEEREEVRYYRADGVCLVITRNEDIEDPVRYCRKHGEEPAFKVVWRVTGRALRREEI